MVLFPILNIDVRNSIRYCKILVEERIQFASKRL